MAPGESEFDTPGLGAAFQVLSIEYNSFKSTSLHVVPSLILLVPTLICIHTDMHTHAHT